MKIFIDHMSQPSRAVLAYCIFSKIPVEVVQIRITKGQHLTPQYQKKNPFKKVPLLQDGQYYLAQSHSIARYLHQKFKPDNNLFHQDIQKKAKINMYLDFHLGGTRKCAAWLFYSAFAPVMGIKSSLDVDKLQKDAEQILKFLDQKMLSDSKYLANNQFSFADISAYCQIIELKLIEYDFSKYPNLSGWLERVGRVPQMVQAHKVFEGLCKKFQQKRKAKL